VCKTVTAPFLDPDRSIAHHFSVYGITIYTDVLHMVPTLWCPEHTNFLPDTIRSLFIHNIVYGSLPDTIPFPLILTNIITPSFSLSLMNYQL
jgi:hypothetical protein